jgi:hypothetical protein
MMTLWAWGSDSSHATSLTMSCPGPATATGNTKHVGPLGEREAWARWGGGVWGGPYLAVPHFAEVPCVQQDVPWWDGGEVVVRVGHAHKPHRARWFFGGWVNSRDGVNDEGVLHKAEAASGVPREVGPGVKVGLVQWRYGVSVCGGDGGTGMYRGCPSSVVATWGGVGLRQGVRGKARGKGQGIDCRQA